MLILPGTKFLIILDRFFHSPVAWVKLVQDQLETCQLNPFLPNAPFLYPLETSENLFSVFWCFQEAEKGCIENEWVNAVPVGKNLFKVNNEDTKKNDHKLVNDEHVLLFLLFIEQVFVKRVRVSLTTSLKNCTLLIGALCLFLFFFPHLQDQKAFLKKYFHIRCFISCFMYLFLPISLSH